jgi:RNA polymerase sigma-70 factor, ECF subfamily
MRLLLEVRTGILIDSHNSARHQYPLAFAGSEPASHEQAKLPQRMDEAAFCALYQEIGPTLRSYIRRASGDAALADDILQETFYRFLRADLPALDEIQRKAYIYRIASTLISDHWRRLKRERRWSLLRVFHSDAGEHAEHDGDAMRVFERLKTQEQALLWLAYVEGFDHREIASALQLKENSIRVLLFRARRKMAGLLGKRNIDPREEI